ncbi:hypothetical protein [Sulfobacillus sp. hq2]|uniref:hypothetical protein n=1 Tax=Sulfobacillus TaxID=28033 RepID=UPI000CD28F4A|nr:hypothetical protein [Sulfobacillus sp. hq2]POB09854.1 hypothetical protein CO251_13220 [Sulfobacillus sp. hq2]
MNMGSPLPPAFAEAEFYHIFFVLLAIVVAGGLIIGIRAYRLGHKTIASPYPAAHEWLMRGIGALWLLDGLLQAQPLMITRFIGGFLAPMLQGQPAPVESLMNISIRLWAINPVLWNEFATWIQIGIGLTMLFGAGTIWRQVGLWTSLAWGLIVWVGGEAFGSLFVGGNWLSGSPGSVLLYMLAAILLLAPATYWNSPRVAKVLRLSMIGLWTLSAFLQAWPAAGWWHGQNLASYVLSMASMPQPAIFSAPLFAWAKLLGQSPALWNGILVGVFAVLAVLWALKPRSGWTWWLTALVTFATWWLGQDFGVLGGMGTDPNSGVVVLIGLVVYAQVVQLPLFHWVSHHEPAVEHSAL